MRNPGTSRLTLLACLLFGVAIVQAAVVPGRWEKVASLERGTPVSVVLKSGARLPVYFEGLDAEAVRIRVPGEGERQIPKIEIQQITAGKKDSNWNGAAIGAGVGLAAGLIISAVQYSDDQESRAIVNLVYAPIGAVSGLVAGYVADRLHEEEDLLYAAP